MSLFESHFVGDLIIIIIMLSLTSVSASEDDIGDVADEFMLLCQRVHAMTVTVYMATSTVEPTKQTLTIYDKF